MKLGLQEDKHHQLNFSDKEREELFDEDVLQFSKKISNPETHLNFWRSLLTLVRGKGKVQLQGDEIMLDNLMG